MIAANRSFAIYRIPGSKTLRLLSQEKGEVSLLHTIEDLNGQSGFVIAPFAVSPSCPIALLHPEAVEVMPAPEGEEPVSGAGKPKPQAGVGEAYPSRFQSFITPIQEKRFQKLVLSRALTLKREDGFSPGEAFLLACRQYTHSYVYLFHTPATGAWLGCTPEILLSGEDKRWTTVALAGTQALRQGGLPDSWDDKNLIEQRLVSYYIRSQLASFDIRPEENGPYAIRAGALAHLRTDFHFTLPEAGRLGDLLRLLHPSPAVSGLPKEEAFRFILANEGYDRRYYAGFIGWLEPGGKSDLYVNLRCMNIQAQTFTLYAGGGLLPSSRLADEWQETEDKLQTILFIINNQKNSQSCIQVKKAYSSL
jgi:isochorismate synthase